MVYYPLRINTTKSDGSVVRFNVKTKKQFLEHYEYIITMKIKKAILNQDPHDVFQRDQGFMVGQGELWMRPFDDVPLIYAINR